MSVLANFFKLVLAIAAAYGVIHLGRPLYWGIQGRLSAYNDVPSGRYLQEAAIHGMGMDIPEASRKNLRSLSLLRHPIEVGAGDQGLVSLHAPRDPAEQEALLRRVGLHSTRTDAADVPDEPAPEKVDSRVAAQVADDKQGSNHEKPTAVVEPAPVEVKKEEVLPSPPPPSPPPPAPVVAPPPPTPVHEHVPDVPGTKASEVSHRKLKYMVPQVDPARVMPAKSTFALTKEFVRNHSTEDGIIIVTWANFHYLDFVLNWVTHLMMNGNTNFVVGAMDDQLLRELYIRNIPTFSMDSGLTTSDFGWGSATFHKMGRQKIDLIGLFTNMGFHTLISDVDTVWLRDPLPYMRQYPDVDVLTSSDNLHNTVDDYSLEKYPAGLGPALNIGIMFFRSTDISRKLAKEWSDILQRDDKVWDQNAFNDLIKRGHSRIEGRHDGVFRGYDHKALAGVLPVSTFCSGHTAFVQKMPWKYGLEPYVIHATFQFSGTEGKRHRFREFEYWIDEPAYYDPPGKNFLVYRPNIPNALLHPPEYTVQSHFDLVNFQILQIRTALMMALALDRILVMPKLWCTNDRWWAPHSGLIPGSRTERPFSCPLDHVFDVGNMLKHWPEDHFGKQPEWREYSFLDNIRMPPAVKNSRLVVEVCQENNATCLAKAASRVHGGDKTVHMRTGMFDTQLKTFFAEASNKRVIEFTSMNKFAFAGFSDEDKNVKFERLVRHYNSIWCCIHAHPGHIWYDMYWDKTPNWQANPPKSPREDRRPGV